MVLPVRRGHDEPGPIGPAVGPHVRPRLRGRGRRAGQSPMTRQPRHQGDQMDADVQRLIDRQEIADLCVRYAFALDTKDWALLESCFTAAPAFVHPGGRLAGFEAILARSRGALESLDAS